MSASLSTVEQLWVQMVSDPELGFGRIEKLIERRVRIRFPLAGEVREYSSGHLKFRRLRLGVGSVVRVEAAGELDDVLETDFSRGLEPFRYRLRRGWVRETDLVPVVWVPSPHQDLELWGDHWGRSDGFDRRCDAHAVIAAASSSRVTGAAGARVKPLPHQIAVMHRVTHAEPIRAVLADEVGQGKTIEAGLIYARLRHFGVAERVCILCPEALQHQWLYEMTSRFGETFRVFGPTLMDSWPGESLPHVLARTPTLLVTHETVRTQQGFSEAWSAHPWDLLIVDEAHRCDLALVEYDPLWAKVQAMAAATRDLLLLTATPRNHGIETLFGLLHLVDPERFADVAKFEEECADFSAQFTWISELLGPGDRVLAPSTQAAVRNLFGLGAGEPVPFRREVVARLLAHCPLSQYLVRNRRQDTGAARKRSVHEVALSPSAAQLTALAGVDLAGLSPADLLAYTRSSRWQAASAHTLAADPKLHWLCEHLRRFSRGKVVVIVSDDAVAAILVAVLREAIGGRAVQPATLVFGFHAETDPVTRDHDAARFASAPDSVVAVLVASRLGSEGRNFQAAQHLIFYDLPPLPDQVEQRIGRVDRIGQSGETIHIWLPFLVATPEVVLVRWLRDGLGAVAEPVVGLDRVVEDLVDDLVQTVACFFPHHPLWSEKEHVLSQLQAATRRRKEREQEASERLIDELLGVAAQLDPLGRELVAEIEASDDDPRLESWVLAAGEHLGLEWSNPDGRGSYTLAIGEDTPQVVTAMPGVSLSAGESIRVTFDRDQALADPELHFLSTCHPLVRALSERELADASSRLTLAEVAGLQRPLLEVLYVLRPFAHRSERVEAFLPYQSFTVVVDGDGVQQEAKLVSGYRSRLREATPPRLKASPRQVRAQLLVPLSHAEQHAARAAALVCKQAEACATQYFEKFPCLLGRKKAVFRALTTARPQFDSLRLWLPG